MKYNHLHLVYAIRGNRGVIVRRKCTHDGEVAQKLPIKTLVATKSISYGEKDARQNRKRIFFNPL